MASRFFLVLFLALIPVSAWADCYTISDPDWRTLCRARSLQNSSLCYAIERQDLRAQCLAEAR